MQTMNINMTHTTSCDYDADYVEISPTVRVVQVPDHHGILSAPDWSNIIIVRNDHTVEVVSTSSESAGEMCEEVRDYVERMVEFHGSWAKTYIHRALRIFGYAAHVEHTPTDTEISLSIALMSEDALTYPMSSDKVRETLAYDIQEWLVWARGEARMLEIYEYDAETDSWELSPSEYLTPVYLDQWTPSNDEAIREMSLDLAHDRGYTVPEVAA